ncbi:MAG: hemerythrin domain-containing protein [Myxococcales bacterium]|nr:hemerythrin domain-containing protein [Myxococcales bacterium]
MSASVDPLKAEHSNLIEMLEKAKSLGITTKEGQLIILSAKNELLAHLKKEDEQLYPVLNEAAKTDSELQRKLELFAKDMKEVSKQAIDFFDTYSEGGSGIDFAKDIGKLVGSLGSRIRREETGLYPEYDKLQ